MKKIITIISVSLMALAAKTQQIPVQSQMYFARLMANPALTAYNGSTNVCGFFRDQWSGVLNHPRVGGAVGEISLWNDRIGTGVEVMSYTAGVTQMIDAKLYYAQKIKLAEGHRLSLGVTAGLVQRGTNATTNDIELTGSDPGLNQPRFTLFDLDIGLAYQWKTLTVGFCIPSLLDAAARSYSNQTTLTNFRRNYLINASYEISIANGKFNVEPLFVFKIDQLKTIDLNMLVMTNYKRIVYLGLGYNIYGGMPITAGVKISKIFTLAYTYQVPIMRNVPTTGTYSTHELTVGIGFDKWIKKDNTTKDAAMAAQQQSQYDSLISRKASADSLTATQKTVDSLAQKLTALQQALDSARNAAAANYNEKKEQEAKLENLNKQIEARTQQQEAAAKTNSAQQKRHEEAPAAEATEEKNTAPAHTTEPAKATTLAPEAKSFTEEAGNKKAPVTGDRFKLENVSFGRNGTELEGESFVQLDKLVSYLKNHKNIRVRVSGHTDSRASESYNGWISRLRARAVAEYLQSKGISAGRIESVGMGPNMPVAGNDTEEGRAKNRRVEVEIIK